MGSFKIDPNERWKTVPKGEYNVMVTKVEEKSPRQGEHNYLEVTMQILDGEYVGENVTDRLSLSPKAKPRLAGFIHAVGLANPETKGEQEFDTNDLVNKFLTVKGDVEVFNGQERFRPSSFKMHPDVARTAAPAEGEAAPAAEEAPAAEATPPPAKPATPPAKAAAPPAKPQPAKPAAAPARRPI